MKRGFENKVPKPINYASMSPGVAVERIGRTVSFVEAALVKANTGFKPVQNISAENNLALLHQRLQGIASQRLPMHWAVRMDDAKTHVSALMGNRIHASTAPDKPSVPAVSTRRKPRKSDVVPSLGMYPDYIPPIPSSQASSNIEEALPLERTVPGVLDAAVYFESRFQETQRPEYRKKAYGYMRIAMALENRNQGARRKVKNSRPRQRSLLDQANDIVSRLLNEAADIELVAAEQDKKTGGRMRRIAYAKVTDAETVEQNQIRELQPV